MSGIWKYANSLYPLIKEEYRLNLNEGNTILQPIEITKERLYLKRDDQNPTGSQKDRSLSFQLSHAFQKNITNFCISSSGNAAVSAAAYFKLIESNNKSLDIFISPNIPEHKKERIENQAHGIGEIKIHYSKQPKKECFQFAKNNNAYNLRGSIDPTALEGFKTIGFELQEQINDADAIFIPSSSGTTFMGIFHSYHEKKLKIPALHLIQTTKVHPIAGEFDKNYISEKTSRSSAITDIIAYRKKECVESIKITNGYGWVVSDEELVYAYKSLNSLNLKVSYDSALSYAGFIKAKNSGLKYNKAVLIITGI